MEKVFAKVEQLADHFKEYVNTRIDSVKLNAAAKTSQMISNLVARIIVAIVFLLFIVFASVAAALAISAWLSKSYSGFLIVSGFYLVLAIIIWKARERLLR